MIRELLRDLLLIGSGGAFTWLFWMIHIQGYVCFKENILWIRYGELAIGVIMVVVGLERLIHHLRKNH